MSIRNKLFKVITLSTAFAISVGLISHYSNNPSPVIADPIIDNFDPYYYSGSYYDAIDFDATGGMNGNLRKALTTLSIPKAFYTYSGSGETHLSTQLQYADEDPTNSNNMIYIYTRNSVPKTAATVDGTIIWNREHVWCQSLSNGNWGTTEGGTDILHLRPAYGSTNSSRGNTPYGTSDHLTPKTYQGMSYGYTGNGFFEPLDSVKGDVARIIMYLWTTYTGYKQYNPLDILDVFESYNTLLSWHTLDKPDVLEGNRNDYVQTSRQKNRNPFVDHPELAWKIFGEKVSDSVRNACKQAYPGEESEEEVEPTAIALNKNTATVEIGKTLQLRGSLTPSNATGTITWSSGNSDIASVNATGLVTANNVGTTTIIATINGLIDTCTVTVSDAIDNYGTLENPLTVADAIELIDKTGANETAYPLYVKGVVSSNTVYNTKYRNYDNVWLKNDDDNVAEAFQLYRVTADSSITSTYTILDSMKDLEVVAYGYGKKYNNETYELTTSDNSPNNPQIISLNAPEATAIALDTYSAELDVGYTTTLYATLTPSNSESPIEWISSDETIATVDDGVVTAVAPGVATIIARVSEDIEAECEITVRGNGLQIATSITVGDSVYLCCSYASMQYSGPSNTSTIYGIGEEYDTKPSAELCELEACKGSVEDSYALKVKYGYYRDQYLAWSRDNSLKLSDAVDANSSWTISFDGNNATIANVADSSRIIWWNNTNPRFACYAGKSEEDGTFKRVQLWKSVYVGERTLDELLDTATSTATLHANETIVSDYDVDSLSISSLGLSNDTAQTGPFSGASETFDVTFNGGCRYFSNGSAIRIYAEDSFTISSSTDEDIKFIIFTWDGSYKPESDDVTDTGTYDISTSTWAGSSKNVTFTRPSGSGHWRLKAIEIKTGEKEISIDTVNMKFGVSIPKATWNDIVNSYYTISDYGVMLVKEATLKDKYMVSSVEEAFLEGYTLSNINAGNGDTPFLDEANGCYAFNAKVNMTKVANYGVTYCAAPYIVIDGEYHFFDEMRYSVNSLAGYYLTNGGSELSNEALTILKGN